ncbi:MAG: nitroreductase [Chloroflexi bacterium]|nr:nitroreductase [Chloroflexota bacterium]MDL1942643.1 nitroreductase [Chloroflexi bacterium CFX2]
MVFDLIRTKRAVRKFTDENVPQEIIRRILDAGRRAQSSKNDQPWHFILIHDRETLNQLSKCGRYAGHLAGAKFGVALVSEPNYDFDLGQAAAYMQLTAWEHGVGSCLAAMWEPEKAKAILGVPDGKSMDIVISFGYPAEPPAPLKKGGRRPLEDVVRHEKWR